MCFRTVRGSNWDGEIAIDNVFNKTIDVPISDAVIKVDLNPMTGDILYISTNNTDEDLSYEISNLSGKYL